MRESTLAKPVDLSARRLIGLAPTAWTRWLTGDNLAQATDLLSGKQWGARPNDVLIKAQSLMHGAFLIANTIQLRPDRLTAQHARACAVLAEERFDLPVYPVVINVLPPAQDAALASFYHAEFMGIVAHQDFRVINLWEVDAAVVFEQGLTPLLPLFPILYKGQDELLLGKAINQLCTDEKTADLEPLLAFFASFVLNADVVRGTMRWDMTVLRESPWYNEIIKEGVEQGIQQGIKQGIEQGVEQGQKDLLLHILSRRFGTLRPELTANVRALPASQLRRLAEIALDAPSLRAVTAFLHSIA
jgi:predicted transposase YdaD